MVDNTIITPHALKMSNQENISERKTMSIVEYVNFLYKSGGIDNVKESIQSQFFDFKILLKDFGETIIKIKYMEHNKNWEKWARESRGVILRLDKTTDLFVCDKQMLIRGAEVLTNVHIKAEITETQDVIDFNEKSYLDDSQIDTIDRLLNSKPIDAFLSFKNDGSLLAVSLYEKETPAAKIYSDIVDAHGDDYAKKVKQLANDMNLPFVPVISSQGTLFLSVDMQDYMTSAILMGTCGMKQEDVIEITTTKTPAEVIYDHGEQFFLKLNKFYESTKHKFSEGSMTLSFEAICKDRRSCWPNSSTHTELAISYPFTDVRFLGCTFNIGRTTGIYVAHFQLENECDACGFDQPFYWKINHANEIENMMCNLTKVISREISTINFFELHPYNNLTKPKNLCIDFEGWIMYKILFDGSLDYSKIKSEEYYVSHKFKENNIPKLIKIANGTNVFPLANAVNMFFVGLDLKLLNIVTNLKQTLGVDNSALVSGLNDKAKISFEKQKPEIQAKMLINASDRWSDICFDIFKSEFSLLNKSQECDSVLKSIVMNVKPWETYDNFNNSINYLVKNSVTERKKGQQMPPGYKCIGELFGLLIKQ